LQTSPAKDNIAVTPDFVFLIAFPECLKQAGVNRLGRIVGLRAWHAGGLMTNSTIRTVTLATSSIALIAAFSFASTLAAAGGGGEQISKTPGLQHHVSKKHHVTGYKGSRKGYPYAPSETLDRETEITRKAGGGGGGGSGM
jgi:hypothetical protein